MRDVRDIQAMLGEGITDPRLLSPKILGRPREPLREREGEPSDAELYNGPGMEGGIAYGPEGS